MFTLCDSVLLRFVRTLYSTNLMSEDMSGCSTHQGRRGQFLKEKHVNLILASKEVFKRINIRKSTVSETAGASATSLCRVKCYQVSEHTLAMSVVSTVAKHWYKYKLYHKKHHSCNIYAMVRHGLGTRLVSSHRQLLVTLIHATMQHGVIWAPEKRHFISATGVARIHQ